MVKKKKDNKKEKLSASHKYKVILFDKEGGALLMRKTFMAERWLDNDDNVVFLRNKDEHFYEPKPENIKDFSSLDPKAIDTKIKELREQLSDELVRDNPEINQRNLEYELNVLLAKKRALKYSTDSSYVYFDINGVPCYMYIREGSTNIPFKWDLDTSTVWAASDNKKKKTTLARENKRKKYSFNDQVQIGTLALLGILILAVIGLIWANSQAFNVYDNSKIAEAQRMCIENTANSAEAIEGALFNIQDITSNIAEQSNPAPQIVVGETPPS